MQELESDRRGDLGPEAVGGTWLSAVGGLGKQYNSCVPKPELTPVPLLSPEPAFSDHLRLCQRPQLQPLPLPHRAQWLRGRAGQLPEGPEL